jgi:hypothetical protein
LLTGPDFSTMTDSDPVLITNKPPPGVDLESIPIFGVDPVPTDLLPRFPTFKTIVFNTDRAWIHDLLDKISDKYQLFDANKINRSNARVIVGTAGSVGTGTFDDLQKFAEVAEEYKV